MTVAIIESGGANYQSLVNALKRLNMTPVVTGDDNTIKKASHIILPGVGSADYGMELLKQRNLIDIITQARQPLLGICLGKQLLCAFSEEKNTECIGIIPLRVEKIRNAHLIPHMGWNNLTDISSDSQLLEGITEHECFYFVHSYAAEQSSLYTHAVCAYGEAFSAVINVDNVYGVQFHPEKSGDPGMHILRNFLRLS